MQSQQTISAFRRTVAYLLGTSFFFYAFVQRVSPSVMTDQLMAEFAVGAAGIGLLSGWYFYTYAIIQLPVGLLVDRFGARKLMSGALLVCAAASIGFSISDSLFWASVYRAIIGGSVAFAFVGTLSIATMLFSPSRFALLAGGLLAVGMLGAIAGQAPLRLLVEYSGWRGSYQWLAWAAAGLSVMIFLLVPKRIVKNSVAAESTTRDTAEADDADQHGLSSVLFNRQSWLCALIGFGCSAAMLAFAGLWAVPWLSDTRELDRTSAASVASVMFLGWAIGSPLMGWLSDAIGKRKPVIMTGSLLAFLTLTIIVYGDIHEVWLLTLLFFVNGLGACTMVTCFGLVREWNHPRNTATAAGFVNMWIVAAGAVMQPLLGALLDANWDQRLLDGVRIYSADAYELAFTALVAVSLLAAVCTFLVRETNCQQQIGPT